MSSDLIKSEGAAWYCIRTQPKHEHIAAGHLRQEAGIEVFLPRIRFRRPTREGPAWFTEALFPNYLFGRFVLQDQLRQVCHLTGVSGVVHFGGHWPSIPDAVIADLRSTIGAEEVHVIGEEVSPGDSVVISGGVFNDLRAVVTRVMPSRQRVAVLLEFLGRQTQVEVPAAAIVPEGEGRMRAFGQGGKKQA